MVGGNRCLASRLADRKSVSEELNPYTASLSRTERQRFIDTLKNLPGKDTKSFLDTPSLFERVKPAFSAFLQRKENVFPETRP